jgi:hypothetical protein
MLELIQSFGDYRAGGKKSQRSLQGLAIGSKKRKRSTATREWNLLTQLSVKA